MSDYCLVISLIVLFDFLTNLDVIFDNKWKQFKKTQWEFQSLHRSLTFRPDPFMAHRPAQLGPSWWFAVCPTALSSLWHPIFTCRIRTLLVSSKSEKEALIIACEVRNALQRSLFAGLPILPVRESRLMGTEWWAQRHCLLLISVFALDLGSLDSVAGVLSTVTKCTLLAVHSGSCEYLPPCYQFSVSPLLAALFTSSFGIAFQVSGLCNLPCPLLLSAGDRWFLLLPLQILAPPVTKMFVVFVTSEATSQWRNSSVSGNDCALCPGSVHDQPCLFWALVCYRTRDPSTDSEASEGAC